MNFLELQESARKLYEAHGDKAEFEAAQHARQHQENGDDEQSKDWQRIREIIAEMRGPRSS